MGIALSPCILDLEVQAGTEEIQVYVMGRGEPFVPTTKAGVKGVRKTYMLREGHSLQRGYVSLGPQSTVKYYDLGTMDGAKVPGTPRNSRQVASSAEI